MDPFAVAAALVVLAALFSFLNARFLRLPTAIGLMALALAFSVAVNVTGYALPGVEQWVEGVVHRIDLNRAFLHGMLGFLLFAGALHVEFNELARHRFAVALLATAGVVISTVVVGLLALGLLALLGIPARFIWCLLFGALISPTDPIAVMGLLKQAGVPRETEVTVVGESLFNDGVGLVVFVGLLEVAVGLADFHPGRFAGLFLWEAGGGVAFGLAAGWVVYRLIRRIDNYQVEVLLTLALVAGGYTLANALHLSGPVAMVVAGLLIGNQGRHFAMSPTTVARLDDFWELTDEFLNAVLFVLIGLVVLVIPFTGRLVLAGLLAVPLVLLARLASVGATIRLLRRWRRFSRFTVRILTWGGLRGGVSVALALSLPSVIDGEPVPEREPIVVLTYVVVAFSILVQGLTVGPLVRRWLRGAGKG